jgi:hypothetical protein
LCSAEDCAIREVIDADFDRVKAGAAGIGQTIVPSGQCYITLKRGQHEINQHDECDHYFEGTTCWEIEKID